MKSKSVILTTSDRIYDLDISTIDFINNKDDGESVISAEFTDDNGNSGTILLSPLLEILSVTYDLPF